MTSTEKEKYFFKKDIYVYKKKPSSSLNNKNKSYKCYIYNKEWHITSQYSIKNELKRWLKFLKIRNLKSCLENKTQIKRKSCIRYLVKMKVLLMKNISSWWLVYHLWEFRGWCCLLCELSLISKVLLMKLGYRHKVNLRVNFYELPKKKNIYM